MGSWGWKMVEREEGKKRGTIVFLPLLILSFLSSPLLSSPLATQHTVTIGSCGLRGFDHCTLLSWQVRTVAMARRQIRASMRCCCGSSWTPCAKLLP